MGAHRPVLLSLPPPPLGEGACQSWYNEHDWKLERVWRPRHRSKRIHVYGRCVLQQHDFIFPLETETNLHADCANVR